MIPDYSKIPLDTHKAIVDWISTGKRPGGCSFVMAVLENNLTLAVVRADAMNLDALPDIVAWLVSFAPALCWGRPDTVLSWQQSKIAGQFGLASDGKQGS